MSNPFDAATDDLKRTMGVEDRAVVQPEKNPFDDAANAMAEQQRNVMGASLRQAVVEDPDEVARRHKVAETTGLPPGVVERNKDMAEQMAKTRELEELARQSPVLARQLSDPEFAKRAHDDGNVLRDISLLDLAKRVDQKMFEHRDKTGQALTSAFHRIGQGSAWIGAAVSDVVSKFVTGPLARTGPQTTDWGKKAADAFRAEGEGRERLAKEAMPKTEGWVEADIYGGISQLPANVAALTLGLLTRSPQAALLPLSGLTFGHEYGKADEKGLGLAERFTYAGSQAVVEYATERAPAMQLLKDLKVGTPFYKMVAHNMVREGFGEQVATVLQDLNEWAALKPEAPFSEYLKERPSAAASTLIQTAVAVGGQTAIVKGIAVAGEAITAEQQRVQRAEQDNVTFTELSKLAQASKLAQRDPQSFAQYVQEVADGGPLEEVVISGEQVAAVMEQLPTAEWPETVRHQLPEALDTGGDVHIPVGEYAATLARTDAGAALLPHLRSSTDAMSLNEAQVFMQSQAEVFKAQAEQILSTEEQGSQMQIEAEQVHQHFTQQLEAANRFTPQVNAGYAALLRDFYVTTSQRNGMTPAQMLQAYPLTITSQPLVDDSGMDQSRGISVVGVHYGNEPGLRELSGQRFGTGAPAEERKRIPTGSPVEKRVNFYLAEGDTLPAAEPVVTGPNVYRARLNNVYDFGADPDKLIDQWRAKRNAGDYVREGVHEMTALEQMVLDAGYSGYINRSNKTVVALGDAVPAQFLGDRTTASMATLEQGPAKVRELGLSAAVERNLKPAEKEKLRKDTAQRMLDLLSKLPPAEEMAAVAQAGAAKRGWYAQSAEAMVNVFGPDAPRFAALLAALSPQTSVESNLTTALTMWKNWTKAGRPTNRDKIYELLSKSVPGQSEKSVLYAWVNNTVRALQAQDPGRIVLSGPKVNSFFLNLVGVTDEVTNDAWMASYAAVDQKLFGGSLNAAGTDPGKSPAYLAMAVRTRETAERLTQATGEQWTPAEVQETVWSWAKTAYETASADTTVLDLVFDAKITDELIASTPDFRTLFSTPRNRKILEAAGYGEKLTDLRRRDAGARAQKPGAQGQAGATPPSDQLIAAAVRLDNLRRDRLEGRAATRSVLEQGPSVGVVAEPSINEAPMVNIGLATNDGKGITVDEALAALAKRGITPVRYEVRQSDSEQTLVAQISRALTPQEADAVSAELRQEAIAQVDEKGKGELYGPKADAWRPFNPMFFVSLDGNRMAQDDPYHPARGHIYFGEDITQGATIALLKNADLSTVFHETGHFFLEVMTHMAAQPAAPADIVADVGAVLKWFGVASLEEWRAMHIDEKRPHHEKFARGFEAYLFEGKAPTAELESLFAKFRAWLINVYQTIKSLDVRLTDEVRTVFDRMLGSEAQIQSMRQMRSMAPLFTSPQEAAATAGEWATYQRLGAEASDDAVRELERRSLADLKWASNARAGELKRLQAEAAEKRKAIRAEVTAEVEAMPTYRAIRFLTNGEIEGAKLSLPALKEMYGTDETALWRYFATGRNAMVAMEGGLHPDNAAELLGFSSGDELVRSVLGAENMQDLIDGVTDQRMLERYGELTDERTIKRAADRAINNEARARFVATELRFLSRIANAPSQRTARGGTVNVLARAAKQFAENIIARKRINSIRPERYRSAEATAAKAALQAADPMSKALQKRNQLVNLYATKAAENAVEELEKGVAYLKRVQKSETIDPDYRDQIHGLLERFSFKANVSPEEAVRRKALAEWVDEQRKEHSFEPQIDKALLAEARRQHYSTLTMEEFRGLVDSVKNIEHLGRLKHRLASARDERDFTAAVAEAAQSINDNAKGTAAERRSSDRGPMVAVGRMARGWLVEHRKFASLIREMDGVKDNGVLWNLLTRGMNEAGAKEAGMRADATSNFIKLLKPILKGPRLGRKTYVEEIKRSFTREERIGIALNMGNSVNRERVVNGEKWTPSQLNAVLNTLTREEWDFVQKVWDMLDSYRPEIAAKMRRVTGTEPEWVEAEEVQTKFGPLRGGYYPIKYDPLLDSKAEADVEAEVQRQMTRGLYVAATTRRGHLQERAESTGRRLRYDFANIVAGHLDQVIHDLSWHEWLIDANRLLRAPSIDRAIREHYGPEKLQQLKKAVRDIAVGELAAQDSWEHALNHLRHGATIVGMGFNVVVSLLQPTGLAQSMVRIGYANVARGMARWIASPVKTTEWIYERSEMMRTRGKTMNREISEIRNAVKGRLNVGEASYFYLIQTMQKLADVPTWLGAYDKAMRQNGMTEDKAIALADQAVLDSQGGGQIKDLASVQRGGAFKKLWTNFYSYFNVTYNLAVERTKATRFTNPLDVARLAVDYLTLLVFPSVLATLIKESMKWDDDSDEEELLDKLLKDQIGYLMGMMIGLREVGAVVSGFYGYQGPAGARFFAEAGKLVQQVQQGEVDEAAIKAGVNVAGTILHLPTGQVVRSVDGLLAYTDGKTDNPGALIVGSNKN